MEKTLEIVKKNVHEVLDKYLCGKLMVGIESEIISAIEWDLAHMEDEDDE